MKVTRGHEAGMASDQRGPTFTGTVWADPVMATTDGVTINTVFFPPGARTHWHRHERGQVLLVTHGQGHVQVRDGEGTVVGPGDAVWSPAGEEHWHGASAETYLTHTAISLGVTEWLEEVTEDDYRASVDGGRASVG
jgi:quercetin dioxygenase-like cupin family protein